MLNSPFLVKQLLAVSSQPQSAKSPIGGVLENFFILHLRYAPPCSRQGTDFMIEVQDSSGGSGANFIVQWFATETVEEPTIEAVMVGSLGTHGYCFSRSGRTLETIVGGSVGDWGH
jgi:hypothetical protein